MELTVYRQSSKTRPDGTVVYKGEDALPYVDENMFFVADGLGGAAAIRHQKIKPELFESDKLVQTLFSGVYDNLDDPRFVKYVTDSFFELFAVKDCYTQNINNIKKSGYFASRIVTAIVLYELLNDPHCQPEALFGVYERANAEGLGQDFLKALGEHFKELIQTNLRAVAANANLVYESSYSGLALLGSTLCATVYYEHDDYVEAIYLTAGDSRPYMWSHVYGLCQVLPDEEGTDGGMTNYIKANDDADFSIRCHYFQFSKPCILFNASDGCFDSGRFPSQLGFEKLIVDQILQTHSPQELCEALTAFFVENGRHDDSSTIAMKTFGFRSYEELQDCVKERAAVLDSDYFLVMPDLLEADHMSALGQREAELKRKLCALKDRFQNDSSVIAYCESQIQQGNYPPYIHALQQITSQLQQHKQAMETSLQEYRQIVARNFLRFDSYMRRAGWSCHAPHIPENSADVRYRLAAYRRQLDDAAATIHRLLEQISNLPAQPQFAEPDEESLRFIEACESSMDALFAFYNTTFKAKKQDLAQSLAQQQAAYITENLMLAQQYPEAVEQLCELLLSDKIDLTQVRLSEQDFDKLFTLQQAIKAAQAQYMQLESQGQKDALRKAVADYWEHEYSAIIGMIVDGILIPTDDAARTEAAELMEAFAAGSACAEEKGNLQRTLFAKYEDGYRLLMGGTAQ